MNIPRYNNFRIILPRNILPEWVKSVYHDILDDAGLLRVYNGDPVNCITESIIGINTPGRHLTISEQTIQDTSKTGFVKKFYPKGINAMKAIGDDEFSLDFRHIDGFHNYHMLDMSIMYMADDSAQKSQKESYKLLDSMMFEEHLSTNWKIINTYSNVIYSQIDGNSFRYADGPSEKTFTVRFKFSKYQSALYYKGKFITEMTYNHAIGN